MSRWAFLLGLGIGLVALAFVVTVEVLGPSPGVTGANVRRIREGMTLKEVEGILGGGATVHMQCRSTVGATDAMKFWQGERGTALIGFFGSDQEGWRVISSSFQVEPVVRTRLPQPPESSLLARLRSWLGW
jgi:hypothetical protein